MAHQASREDDSLCALARQRGAASAATAARRCALAPTAEQKQPFPAPPLALPRRAQAPEENILLPPSVALLAHYGTAAGGDSALRQGWRRTRASCVRA